MRDLLRGLGSVQLAVLHGFSSESCFWSLGVGWEAPFFLALFFHLRVYFRDLDASLSFWIGLVRLGSVGSQRKWGKGGHWI